jgi:mono/diheme cytochrome c family protein
VLLAALSAGQKTGLAVVAAAFVVFAIVSAFGIPRYKPDFPGSAVRLFVIVSAVFAAGMLTAVAVLGSEKKEPKEAVTTTSTPPGSTSASTTTTAAPPPRGDPAAGKQLFAAQGCGSCHTYAPAGSTAKVGPDLDHLAADAQKANQPLIAYVKTSITDPNAYVVPGFPKGVMPSFGATLNSSQIDDLAAFLTQH